MSSVELSLHAQAGRTLNGWAMLGKVDVSTPLPGVIGWVSRMVLASCG